MGVLFSVWLFRYTQILTTQNMSACQTTFGLGNMGFILSFVTVHLVTSSFMRFHTVVCELRRMSHVIGKWYPICEYLARLLLFSCGAAIVHAVVCRTCAHNKTLLFSDAFTDNSDTATLHICFACWHVFCVFMRFNFSDYSLLVGLCLYSFFIVGA